METPTDNNTRFKQIIRFYSLKFHFITVPLTLIIAIVHLRFAIKYIDECPIQPMINIYMIVHAAVHLSIMLITFLGVINIRCIYPSFQHPNQTVPRVILISILAVTLTLMLFSFGWLIAGSVWVFGAKANGVQGSDSTDTTTYCQTELYRSAFVLLIVNYVVHIIIFSVLIFKRICQKQENKE